MDAALAITIAVALVVALAFVVALVVTRSRRREDRRRRRLAALADLAEVMAQLSDQLRETPPVHVNLPAYVPDRRATATLVGGLPGRAALLDSLAERVATAEAAGTRLVLAILSIDRVGSDELRIDGVARAVARLANEPVHRVGDSSLALVLPGRGRAEVLALIARAEAELRERGPGAAAVIAHSVAVELEPGDDAVALLARASHER